MTVVWCGAWSREQGHPADIAARREPMHRAPHQAKAFLLNFLEGLHHDVDNAARFVFHTH